MEHYHYIVNGFMHEEADGKLVDFASIDVLAKNEQGALVRAKKLVEKKHYRVASVITHDTVVCPRVGA
jgi:hypothetical protein